MKQYKGAVKQYEDAMKVGKSIYMQVHKLKGPQCKYLPLC